MHRIPQSIAISPSIIWSFYDESEPQTTTHSNGNRNNTLLPLSTYILIGKLISMSIENSIRRRDAADQIFRNDWSCRVGIWNYSSISTAVKGRNRLALERYDFRVFEINERNCSVIFLIFLRWLVYLATFVSVQILRCFDPNSVERSPESRIP